MRAAPASGAEGRGERTRRAIVEALLAIIDDGALPTTARRIAERAGVSERSLYVHFADLDALYRATGARHTERLEALFATLATTGPLAARCDAMAVHRAAVCEQVLPMRRAVYAHSATDPVVMGRVAAVEEALRAQLARQFAPELSRLAPHDRHGWLAAAGAATSPDAWRNLRDIQGLGFGDASAALARVLVALVTHLQGVGAEVPDSPGGPREAGAT